MTPSPFPVELPLALAPRLLGLLGLVPVAVLGLVAAGFLGAWWSARARLQRFYAAPLRLKWSTEAAIRSEEPLVAELNDLGYEAVGTLLQREPLERTLAVFTHRELPIYAFLVTGPEMDRPAVVLDSFFAGGERITSSGLPGARESGALVDTGSARLVQFRVGGTPTALDGQHVGTLRAWTSSRSTPRKPLPATREALIAYLEADHIHTRDALAARGWVRPSTLLRFLAGQPKNALGF